MTTIVTLGGGGFSETGGKLTPLDHVLLGLAGRRLDAGVRGRGERPAVCFVPTASGDAAGYCEKFERAYGGVAETSVLTLFNQSPWGLLSDVVNPSMLLHRRRMCPTPRRSGRLPCIAHGLARVPSLTASVWPGVNQTIAYRSIS